MKEKIIDLDNNNYLMIDDNKEISIVETANELDEILFYEDIMKRDKEFDEFLLNEIKEIEEKIKKKKYSNGFLLISEIFYILSVLILPANLTIAVIYAILIPIIGKILITSIFGTNDKLNKSLHEWKIKKEAWQATLDIDEKKLKDLKQKNNYKKESLVEHIDRKYCEEQELGKFNTNEPKRLVLKPEYRKKS